MIEAVKCNYHKSWGSFMRAPETSRRPWQ